MLTFKNLSHKSLLFLYGLMIDETNSDMRQKDRG
jgi:hypothetical protein